MSRIDAGMSQPGPDHIQIDARLEQVHGRGVPPGMRPYLPCEESGIGFGGIGYSMADNITQSESCKPVAFAIYK